MFPMVVGRWEGISQHVFCGDKARKVTRNPSPESDFRDRRIKVRKGVFEDVRKAGT
jgi:hypothetical protein